MNAILSMPGAEPVIIIEIEQETLGTLMMGGGAREALAFLRDYHFLEPFHAAIFRAIQTAYDKYGVANTIYVRQLLGRMAIENFEAQAGRKVSDYLASLCGMAIAAGPAALERARMVSSQWGRVSVVNAAVKASMAASDAGANVSQIVHDVARTFDDILAEVNAGSRKRSRVSIGSAVEMAVSAANEARKRDGGLTGVTWGLADINRQTGGIQKRDLTLIGARPSMGKAQPLTAKVRTIAGWKPIGDLRIGDQILSVDGDENFVTGVFPQGKKEIYRITFSDGRSTRCCAEHLWLVHYRGWDSPRVLSTADVIEKLSKARYRGRLWIDVPAASGGGSQGDLPIDPWVLGALLGDGGLSGGGVRFSSACEETVNRLAERLPSECRIDHVAAYDFAVTMKDRRRNARGWPEPNLLKESLKALGLLGLTSDKKFIPDLYLDGSAEQRLDLLRGLLDTDGWVEQHGTVCIGSVSERLASDICDLARSLGAWCSVKKRQKSFTYKGERRTGKPAFVCVISHPQPSSLFLMTSKVERTIERTRRKLPVFVSIVPDGVEEAQCISVSHPSKLYVTDDYVVTHNTTLGLSVALKAAKSGAGVGFFSLEMDSEKIGARAASDWLYDWRVQIPYVDVIRGNVNDRQMDDLAKAVADIERLPIWVDDQSSPTVTDIRVRTEKMMEAAQREGKPFDVVFIDHLGLIKPSSRYQGNRTQEIGEMTASLKAMARDLDIAVVLLSQLNRAVETRAEKVPQLSDLRDSGSIEQDADMIAFLYREAYYLERGKTGTAEEQLEREDKLAGCRNKLEFHIAKQRNGPVTKIDLFADMAFSAIRNGAGQWV